MSDTILHKTNAHITQPPHQPSAPLSSSHFSPAAASSWHSVVLKNEFAVPSKGTEVTPTAAAGCLAAAAACCAACSLRALRDGGRVGSASVAARLISPALMLEAAGAAVARSCRAALPGRPRGADHESTRGRLAGFRFAISWSMAGSRSWRAPALAFFFSALALFFSCSRAAALARAWVLALRVSESARSACTAGCLHRRLCRLLAPPRQLSVPRQQGSPAISSIGEAVPVSSLGLACSADIGSAFLVEPRLSACAGTPATVSNWP